MAPTTRVPAEQHEILEQIVARLRGRIDEYDEWNCILSDQIVPPIWPTFPLLCTVSPGSGQFDDSLFTGGGHAQIGKSLSVRVTPYVRTALDRPPEAVDALVSAERGLIRSFEGRILGALLCEEIDGDIQAWEPCNEDGEGLLRNQLYPVSTAEPQPDQGRQFLGMTIEFRADFDWKLPSW